MTYDKNDAAQCHLCHALIEIPMKARSKKKSSALSKAKTTTIPTRDLILDVAEEAFATHGYVGTSIRMIATGANITLGNLHYHFKTKESLYLEVFQRCGLPLVEERMRLLDEATQKHGKNPIPLRELILCFITPFLRATMQPRGEAFSRLHSRLPSEPHDLGETVRGLVYNTSTTAYIDAFKATLPELPEDVLYWRLHFMIGANTYTLQRSGRLEFISGGLCQSTDIDAALQQLVPFLEAGLRAPVPD